MLATMKLNAMRAAAATVIALLAACGSLPLVAPPVVPAERSAWVGRAADTMGGSRWHHYKLPGKQATQFEYARKDGRDALAVNAQASASMLRRKLTIPPQDLGSVRFSWKVPELIADADLATRDADDSPVRVILAFEGDRRRLSARDSMLSELALVLTGEEMPYATLMYVWCNKREPGSVIVSARTDRVRAIVMESGPSKLDQWLDYERNIRADYQRAFGEAPGALVGIAIMTDSDNTRSTARAWYGPVSFAPAPSVRR